MATENEAPSSRLTAWMKAAMPTNEELEKTTVDHLLTTIARAEWRVEDDKPTQKRKGYHRHAVYTDPEGNPEFPRQYKVATHADEGDVALLAANSYAAAIAVQELIKKRGF